VVERLNPAFLASRGDPVVVSSYMRSGTHLTIDFLRRNFPAFRSYKWPLEANDSLYLPIDALIAQAWGPRRAHRVLRRTERVICKTHWCDPDFQNLVDSQVPSIGNWLRDRAKVILIHRDPYRTIESVVVWYVFTGELTNAAIPPGPWLSERLHEWVTRIRAWQRTPRPFLSISSDLLLRDPAGALDRIAAFVGAEPDPRTPILPPQLRGSLHSRLNRVFAMRPQSSEILTIRPAPIVRWSEEQLALVEQICGELCRELGYAAQANGYFEPNPVSTVRPVRSMISTSSQGEK